MSEEIHLPELTEAARRAGSILSEQINSIADVLQRQADEIQRTAEHDAKATRREAMESAQRVLQGLDALERPLGELVQTLRVEMGRVGRELEGPVAVEATAIPATPEIGPAGAAAPGDGASVAEVVAEPEQQPPPEPEQQPPPEPQQQATSESEPAREKEAPRQHEPAPAEAAQSGQGNGTQTGDAPAAKPQSVMRGSDEHRAMLSPPSFFGPEKKSGRFQFHLRGGREKGAFITTQGHCAVCQKTFMAGTEENLWLSGWKMSGDVGVCPECQADGWQLPDGARLPFRRGGG